MLLFILHPSSFILALSLLALLPVSAFGQELTLDASVDRTRLGSGESLSLTIEVSGRDLSDVPEPTLPDLPDFFIVGRSSSTSSSINIINGKITSSRTIQYIYQLQPRGTGTFTIGAATIRYNGRTYRTAPITVEVVRDAYTPGRGGGTGAPQPGADQPVRKDDLFIAAEPNKTEAYVGEQVTLSYTLYTRIGLSNVQYGQIPAFTGFWMEELFSADHLNFSSKIIKGKRYDAAPLKRVALFPTVVGEHVIEPLSIVCDVPAARRRSVFDRFFDDPFDSFFGRTRRLVLQSDADTIRVRPLPAEGKPPHFSGGVGRFSISGAIDPRTVEVNQPMTLTVTLKGQGNLKTVDEPVLPDLPDFKRYASSSKEEIVEQAGRIGGKKTYTYVLIPMKPGNLEIPPVTFSFFDPSEKRYKTVKTAPIMTAVTLGRSAPVASGYGVNRSEVRQLSQDIQYIKPETAPLSQQGVPLYRSPWFLWLHALPVLTVIGVFLYQSHTQRLREDVGYARWRRAYRKARRELQQAEHTLKRGDMEQAHAHIARALHTYIGDKCNASVTGLTARQTAELLEKRGIKTDTLRTLTECLDACDMARFAPTALTRERTRSILDAAKNVIATLEQRLAKPHD